MTIGAQNLRGTDASSIRRLPIEYEMIGPTVMALDCILLLALAPLATIVLPWLNAAHGESFGRSAAVSAVFCGLIVPMFSLRGIYDPATLSNFPRQLRTIVLVCAFSFALMIFVAMQLNISPQTTRFGAMSFVGALVLMTLHHMWWSIRLQLGVKYAGIRPAVIALITVDGRVGAKERSRLEELGYDIRLLFSLKEFGPGADRRDASEKHLRGAAIDEVVLSLPYECLSPELMQELAATPFPVRFLPDDRLSDIVAHPCRWNGSAILFDVRSGPLTDRERHIKRLFDVVVAIAGLLVVGPFLILVGMAIALETPGPVLFQQTRLGFNGVPFKIYKFRSMTVMEDGPNVVPAKRGDVRVTRIGRFIRRFSIDELPQLFNVLRGEMSLVGPRPHALAHDQAFDRTIADYANRQYVKPGLTGWAQINGHRGENSQFNGNVQAGPIRPLVHPQLGLCARPQDHPADGLRGVLFEEGVLIRAAMVGSGRRASRSGVLSARQRAGSLRVAITTARQFVWAASEVHQKRLNPRFDKILD